MSPIPRRHSQSRADLHSAQPTILRHWFRPCIFAKAPNPTSTEPYSLTMTISGKDKDSEGNDIFVDTHTFGPVELPNLPFLPRNTHVVINIHLTGTDIECTVKLVPYTGIWLDPDFGIDRD